MDLQARNVVVSDEVGKSVFFVAIWVTDTHPIQNFELRKKFDQFVS